MRTLNAKEELGKIANYQALIEEKTEDLIQLDSLIKKLTAALDGETVSKSKNHDQIGTFLVNKERLLLEIVQLQEAKEKQKVFLCGIIDSLEKPVYIKVLYGLYINGNKIKTVADKIGYSYRYTQDLRDVAIQNLQKIMDEIESSHKIS